MSTTHDPARRGFVAGALAAAAAMVSGCVPQLGPYQAKATTAPTIKNCFDSIGHQGFKPFVLGGNCYCNPLPAQIAQWRSEGAFEGRADDEIVTMYKAKNLKTLYDHRECNNLCEWGPHVAKGGTCMVPPTPLTDNYEEVATGTWKKA